VTASTRIRRSGHSPLRAACGDARSRRDVVERADAALVARGDRQAAAAELEVGQLVQDSSGLAHEVEARDPGVGGAVGDELGNVLRAHKQSLELPAERRGEGARAGRPDLETGVGEKLASLLGEPSLVG